MSAQRKLSDEDAEQIRQLYEWKTTEQRRLEQTAGVKALAAKFGVHYRTIERTLAFEIHRGNE